jgi:hypothetical protein
VRRDGAGFTDVVRGVRNDLFLRGGLDTPNQTDFAEQIKFCVKSNSWPANSMGLAFAARDCPSPQINVLRHEQGPARFV